MVQYRDKTTNDQTRRKEVEALLGICRPLNVPLLVNDDVELAADIRADGVHVGRDDASLARARRRLGPDSIVGVSCYNSLDRARAAQAAGATYVAFGSFFASPTKPGAVPASTELLRAARRTLRVPIVAIGGITPANAPDLLEAGADLLAVVSAIFAPPDPAAAAREFARLFSAYD